MPAVSAFRAMHLLQLFYEEILIGLSLFNAMSLVLVEAGALPQEAEVVVKQQKIRLEKMFNELSLVWDVDGVFAPNIASENLLADMKDLWTSLSTLYLSVRDLKPQSDKEYLMYINAEQAKLAQRFLALVEKDISGGYSLDNINNFKKMIATSPLSMVKTQDDVPLSITFALLS